MNGMEPYLIHYGIPKRSGRYPYGSGKRPFQSSGGGIPVKKKSNIFSLKSKSSRKPNEENQKQKDPEEEKRKYAAEKERAIKEGNASDVMKFKGDLTNQQMQDALNRIRLENQLSEISNKEIKKGMDKIDTIMKSVQTVTNWGKIGTDTWNLLASIYNATPEGQENPWPIIKKG